MADVRPPAVSTHIGHVRVHNAPAGSSPQAYGRAIDTAVQAVNTERPADQDAAESRVVPRLEVRVRPGAGPREIADALARAIWRARWKEPR